LGDVQLPFPVDIHPKRADKSTFQWTCPESIQQVGSWSYNTPVGKLSPFDIAVEMPAVSSNFSAATSLIDYAKSKALIIEMFVIFLIGSFPQNGFSESCLPFQPCNLRSLPRQETKELWRRSKLCVFEWGSIETNPSSLYQKQEAPPRPNSFHTSGNV